MSESKKLITNTSALFLIQVANYVLPFLLIPYLTRVLGVESYGIVSFGLAMVQIGCIVTDYGFNLSATYQIASNRENKPHIDKIISSVFICKVILLLIVVSGTLLYSNIQEKYGEQHLFFSVMALAIVGQTFQPLWFFQGIERMVVITIYTLSAKVLYVVLVFLLVSSPDDLLFVAWANGAGQLIAAVIGIVMMGRLGYRFLWPGRDFIKNTFQQSTSFFWSRAAFASYTTGGIFLLGIISTPTQVAFYSAAEQMYKGGRALLDSGAQALYPYMVNSKNFRLFFRVLIFSIGVSLLGLLIGIFAGEWFIELLFGKEYILSYSILVIFLIVLVVVTPSVLLGFPFLGALNRINLANRSVIYGGVLQVFLLGISYYLNLFSAFQLVCTVLVSETFILIIRVTYATKFYKGN